MSKLTCIPIIVNGFYVGVTISLAVVMFLFVGALAFVRNGGVGVLHKDPAMVVLVCYVKTPQ
jgi:hypothetical protein